MKQILPGLFLAVFALTSTPVSAANKHETFVGQYMAAYHISVACDGMHHFDEQTASDIAKSQEGLRKQKVLRLLFYGKTSDLFRAGNIALDARGVNPESTTQKCKFGKQVIGTDDAIGRFLVKV